MTRTCSIPDCGKPHDARGWCQMHYLRWKRHGDPLGDGKTSPGDRMRFFTDVVLPYQGDGCLSWPYSRNRAGYGRMTVNGRSASVCRAVCEAMYGPPPTPNHEAAHSCGKGHEGCVNPRHLRWATSAENKADQVFHGTAPFGEQNPAARLSDADVFRIRGLRGKMSRPQIAALFGITPHHVTAIQVRRAWAHLTDDRTRGGQMSHAAHAYLQADAMLRERSK